MKKLCVLLSAVILLMFCFSPMVNVEAKSDSKDISNTSEMISFNDAQEAAYVYI